MADLLLQSDGRRGRYARNLRFIFRRVEGRELHGDILVVSVHLDVVVTTVLCEHKVHKGDTLSSIAKEYCGIASEYMVIFDANRSVLDDPDKIYPGQVLKIPSKGC